MSFVDSIDRNMSPRKPRIPTLIQNSLIEKRFISIKFRKRRNPQEPDKPLQQKDLKIRVFL